MQQQQAVQSEACHLEQQHSPLAASLFMSFLLP